MPSAVSDIANVEDASPEDVSSFALDDGQYQVLVETSSNVLQQMPPVYFYESLYNGAFALVFALGIVIGLIWFRDVVRGAYVR